MSYGWPAPPGDLWVGAYVDDVLILEVVPAAMPERGRQDLDILDSLRAGHREAGTRLHPTKERIREEVATVWGARIDGRAGTVRGEAAALHQLIKVTAEAILAGGLTPHMMMRLVSSWTHHMMFFRSALCIFGAVYEFTRLLPAHRRRLLPPAVVEELLFAMISAPLLVCDCRAPVHERVYATDATTTIGAAVFAEPSDLELAWLWSRMPRRGAYARLFIDDEQDGALDRTEVRDEVLYNLIASL
jgi:hypothetical protein